MTTKISLRFSSTLLAIAVAAPACVALGQGGVAERAGQALDDVGREIRRGVHNAFARTRAVVHDQEVIARVYSRIHWDKTLVGSVLELEVRDGGTTILRGSVPDAAAKRRAVTLARDTVGVTHVVDELAVLSPARAVPLLPPTTIEGTTTTTPASKP